MNEHEQTKPLTVAELAAKADTPEDKAIVKMAESFKDMIPGIMDFPIVRQRFINVTKQ